MRYDELVEPSVKCDDKNCPYHGNLRVHGMHFEGVVVSSKSRRTAVVAWERHRKLEKYEIYLKDKTKVLAHNPDCIGAKEGDKVIVYETRPISRWKKFVIVRKL